MTYKEYQRYKRKKEEWKEIFASAVLGLLTAGAAWLMFFDWLLNGY